MEIQPGRIINAIKNELVYSKFAHKKDVANLKHLDTKKYNVSSHLKELERDIREKDPDISQEELNKEMDIRIDNISLSVEQKIIIEAIVNAICEDLATYFQEYTGQAALQFEWPNVSTKVVNYYK